MEAGKLVQLLSLLNFPQTTEDDLVAWNEANQAIIGDYQGPIDFAWAFEKLSDLLGDEESREEVLEAISISAQFAFSPIGTTQILDSNGAISGSTLCSRLADLLITNNPELQIRVVKCFAAIVKEDANRFKVAHVAGMLLFNMNRSSNMEIAQISSEITHELFQNAQALEYLTNCMEKVNRTELDTMRTHVDISRPTPGVVDLPSTPSGKSNPNETEKSSSKKKDGANRNYVDTIGRVAKGTISSAIDISSTAALHFRKNVFPAGLEATVSGSPSDSASVLTTASGDKKSEAIWWRDLSIDSHQKARSGSISARGSGLMASAKEIGEKPDNDYANNIHNLLQLWRRHQKISRGIVYEYKKTQKHTKDVRLLVEYQNFASLVILELEAEKKAWRQAHPQYERFYDPNYVSQMDFALELSLRMLHSPNSSTVSTFVSTLADFMHEDEKALKYVSEKEGILSFGRLLESSDTTITCYALRAILLLCGSDNGHRNRKIMGKDNAIPKLCVLASADAAEPRKLAAKILLSLIEERKLKSKVYNDPNLPAYLTLTDKFQEFEHKMVTQKSAPQTAAGEAEPQENSQDVDFRRKFNLPDSERILKSYSCALLKQLPVHGRVWISNNYICFYSGIIGLKTMDIIPVQLVKSINKTTHKIINPAIELVLEGRPSVQFMSFYDRDSAFNSFNRFILQETVSEVEEEVVDFLGSDESKFVDLFQNQELPIPVEKYFSLIHGDDSAFAREYHESRGDQDLTINKWVTDPKLGQTRELRYVVNTNAPIGPKTAQVLDTQRYTFRKEGNMHIIETICSMREAPYGDCFVVETKIVAQPAGPNKTRVDAMTALNFTKSCFIQGTIERASIRQAKQSYQDWIKLAEDFSKNPDRNDPKVLERKKATETETSSPQKGTALTGDATSALQTLQKLSILILIVLTILVALVVRLLFRVDELESALQSHRQVATLADANVE